VCYPKRKGRLSEVQLVALMQGVWSEWRSAADAADPVRLYVIIIIIIITVVIIIIIIIIIFVVVHDDDFVGIEFKCGVFV
jgi:heme/copper-type cytochrome/quinol oxidase subunit 2